MVRILHRLGWSNPATSPSRTSARQPAATTPSDIYQTHSSTSSKQQRSLTMKKWVTDGLAFTLMFGGSALIAGCGWFSYQLIVNPDIGIWLNQFLPASTQIPLQRHESIKTLDEIRDQLQVEGLRLGNPLPLPTPNKVAEFQDQLYEQNPYLYPLRTFLMPPEDLIQTASDLLVPVVKKRESSVVHPCESNCQEIVELRVYESILMPYQRSGTPSHYRMVHQLKVKGPAESYVLASLIGKRVNQQGSNKPQPLMNLKRFTDKVPNIGIWFNLYSTRIVAGKKVPYGQIVHYNPTYNHLSMMLEWKSPAGQQPIWQEITGGANPELLIEETLGLEPHFSVFEIKPKKFVPNPIQLSSISLDEAVLDHYNYRKALRLAQSGLWSPASELMISLKENVGKDRRYPSTWPAVAQAQLDLIQFHAKITDAQAAAAWASPSQQVLAGLIDGRWTEALNVLQTDRMSTNQLNTLLQADEGRLKLRIQAALAEDPQEPDLQAWGALVVAAQRGEDEALSWLDRRSFTTTENRDRIRQLLEL
ncbi:MAG: hypothetical protein WBA13_12715 [Microcoleaceae cyanobacterium]